MKIGMKEVMDVVNKMTSLVLGSPAHSKRNCARCTPKKHKFAISEGWKRRMAMKISMKEEMGVTNKMTSLVLGWRAHNARNCAHSTPKLTFLEAGSKGLQ